MLRRFAALGGIVAVAAFAVVRVAAHEIPADIVVRLHLRPDGQRLHALVRVPLAAMRDIEFPQHGPGYLQLDRADAALRMAAQTWIADALAVYENGERISGRPAITAVRVSLPSDPAFASFDAAAAHLRGPPLPVETTLIWNQALLDVWLEYPIQSAASEFAVEPAFARLGVRVLTVMQFRLHDSAERAFEFTGNPGLVRLDPRWHQAALHFIALGFEHILDGIDHLLFLFCLVLPFRRFGSLVIIVTSFTVAHSITLIVSAMGFAPDALWFPPLVETLIAASIVYMALENIYFSLARSAGPDSPLARIGAGAAGMLSVRRRWAITFAFGLVHGFGFSFALRETMQFAGSHLATSLLAFNVGVELGQLLVLAMLVPLLYYLFTRVVVERIGVIIASALIAHTAWHWMLDRGAGLGDYDWSGIWPTTPATIVRWLLAAVLAAAAIWLLRRPDVSRESPRTDGVLDN